MSIEYTNPNEIEARSFEIIGEELARLGKTPDGPRAFIVKRCIHASADFDYADSLYFSEGAVEAISAALVSGVGVVTDTQMALAGISKTAAGKLGVGLRCFMADEDVAARAKALGITRAAVSVEKAAASGERLIFAVGNAPTALLKLHELTRQGYEPAGIIAAPVGFVNVVESKELIIRGKAPCIAARGRKGGSSIAAAIVNAFLYEILKTGGGL